MNPLFAGVDTNIINDAVAAFTAALDDPESSVQITAASALGRLGATQAIEPLVRLLADKRDVRLAAARALSDLGQPEWTECVKGDYGDFERLGCSHDQRALVPLLRALDNVCDRDHAAWALGELGSQFAVEPLLSKARVWGGTKLGAAVRALGKLGDTRAVKPLLLLLADSDTGEEAAQALAALGHPEWEDLIKEWDLQNPTRVDHSACSSNSIMRNKARLHRLGRSRDKQAVEPLIRALGDSLDFWRIGAAETLAGLGETKWRLIVRGDLADFARLGSSGDPRAVESLVNALTGSPSPEPRQEAAMALASLGAVRAVEPLIEALETWLDDDPALPVAAKALGRFGDKRAVEPLIRKLVHGVPAVRLAAAAGLADLGQPEWRGLVNGANYDFDRLADIGDIRLVKPLVRAARFKAYYQSDYHALLVRQSAVRALTRLAEKRPDAVIPLWGQIWRLAREPERCVSRHGEESDYLEYYGIGVPWPEDPPKVAGVEDPYQRYITAVRMLADLESKAVAREAKGEGDRTKTTSEARSPDLERKPKLRPFIDIIDVLNELVLLVSCGYVFYKVLRGELPVLVALPCIINSILIICSNVLSGYDKLPAIIAIEWGTVLWTIIAIWAHHQWIALALSPLLITTTVLWVKKHLRTC